MQARVPISLHGELAAAKHGKKAVAGLELSRRTLSLRHGDHLCLFYEQDPAEQMPALIPFIQEGLAGGEQFIYVADDQTVDELAGRLERGGIDVAKESERGALRLLTPREWRQAGAPSAGSK